MKTAIIFFTLLFSLPTLLFSQEKKISKKDVPEAVLKAFHSAYPNATAKQYNRETEKGKTYFEVESVDGKIKRDVLYNPDGTLAETEEMMSDNDLPQPVKDAVKKNYSHAKIKRIEKTTKGTATTYEILFMNKKKRSEVVFSPEGSVVKD